MAAFYDEMVLSRNLQSAVLKEENFQGETDFEMFSEML